METAETFSPARIAQIEVHCTDLGQAEAFYCGALGLPLVGKIGDSIFVACGEVNLIVQASANPKLPGNMIYFAADGCVHEATRALKTQGIAFTQEPRCIARDHQGCDIWLGFSTPGATTWLC